MSGKLENTGDLNFRVRIDDDIQDVGDITAGDNPTVNGKVENASSLTTFSEWVIV